MSELKSLFFYDFFQQLRIKVGIELDYHQYEQFLDCLIICKPADESSLYNLCKTLWLTRDSYRSAFDALFKDAFLNLHIDYLKLTSIQPEPRGSALNKPIHKDLNTNETEPKEIDPKETISDILEPYGPDTKEPEPATLKHPERTNREEEWTDVILNIQESQNLEGTPEQLPERSSAVKNPFLFSDSKHLPFSIRKTQQLWRRYKGKHVLELTDELDLISTIQNYSKEKVLDQLRFKYKHKPIEQIIWLSDHSGDMTPFEEWDNVLFDVVKGSSVFKDINRFYFHRYPIIKQLKDSSEKEFLVFKDKAQIVVQSLNDLYLNWHKNVLVIIFSDGGAARNHNESDRLAAFYDLYNFLNTKAKILWLNPMEDRVGSSAGFLSLLLPMYDLNDDSLQLAIRNL